MNHPHWKCHKVESFCEGRHVTPSRFSNWSAPLPIRWSPPPLGAPIPATSSDDGNDKISSPPSILELILSFRLVCRPGTSTRKTSVRSRTVLNLSWLIVLLFVVCRDMECSWKFLFSATLFLSVVLDRFFFPPNYLHVFPPFVFFFCISIKFFLSSFSRNIRFSFQHSFLSLI